LSARRARGAFGAAALLAALVAISPPAATAAAAGGPPKLNARSWLLIDAKDGEQLASRSPQREAEIASTTKLMTAYLALKQLPLNRSLRAAAYTPTASAEVVLGLEAGEKISVRDLLYALLLPSANDAAFTLAKGVAKSERAFVGEMNEAARKLDLEHTHYANPIGLDAPGNRSNAEDLAALTQDLRKLPTFRRIVDTPRLTLRTGAEPRTVTSRNTLLLQYPWINGVKTGHTLQAGYVLVASGTQKGATLISVVLGAPSEAVRDSDTLKLMRYGFAQYTQQKAVSGGEVVSSPEVRYQEESLDLRAAADLLAPVRRGQRVKTKVELPDQVEGPLKKGEGVGAVTAVVDGNAVARVPLLAAHSVGRATTLDKVNAFVPGPAIILPIAIAVILIGVVVIRRRRGARPRTAEDRMRQHEERMRRRRERSS
jgi:D-alanyl-D-alanine carboxypeptidase (penicillin-binding protein 5/6)